MVTEAQARSQAAPVGGVPRWMRVAGGIVVAGGAAESAVLEVFYVPLRVGTVVLPVSILAAVVLNVVFPRVMFAATFVRWAVAVPAVLWLVVMVAMALGRPEGDVVLPGTWVGLGVLFGGTAAAAFGVTRALPRP